VSPAGYDAAAVARLASSRHPGLDPAAVDRLAVLAGEHLHDLGSLDAPELARRLLADEDPPDASAATVIAAAAVEHCESRDS
jgi:hypothetical protein